MGANERMMARREMTRSHSVARSEVIRLNAGILPAYCTAEVTRHGRVCVYFRQVGRTGRIRIRPEPGTGEFYSTYGALLNGDVPKSEPASTRKLSSPQTWRWLCERYFQSMQFRGLAAKGQRIRRRALEGTYSEPISPGSTLMFADCPLHKFTSKAARVLRDLKVQWIIDGEGEEVRSNLEAANSRLKYIRGVLAFAKEEYPDLVERNWALDVDYFKSASEGHHTWTVDEIAQFEARHAIGTKARLTMALALYTSQRRGDVNRLGRWMEKNGVLEVIQEKNRRVKPVTAYVPIVPALRRIIDASPTGDLFYVVQENGQPYAKESLGNLFRQWCDEAGLPHCSLHGLRKACVVRLIMDGCTPHEIMAVTGHQTLKEIDRYARKFMRQQAAGQVLSRWLSKHASLP